MAEPVIVPHPNTVRGPIESEFNGLRDAIEKKYVSDKEDLEAQYHEDLAANQSDKEDALVAAGLNPDGGVPPNYGVAVRNTAVPTIAGTTTVGEELTADPGDWTNSPTLAYKWRRADNAQGANVADIADATDATYTLQAEDEGKRVRVVVTATNVGSAPVSASSSYTAAIAAVPAP